MSCARSQLQGARHQPLVLPSFEQGHSDSAGGKIQDSNGGDDRREEERATKMRARLGDEIRDGDERVNESQVRHADLGDEQRDDPQDHHPEKAADEAPPAKPQQDRKRDAESQ